MDRIIETQYGYDVIVNNKQHGTWRSESEAAGGLRVEQRRDVERAAKLALMPGGVPGLPVTQLS